CTVHAAHDRSRRARAPAARRHAVAPCESCTVPDRGAHHRVPGRVRRAVERRRRADHRPEHAVPRPQRVERCRDLCWHRRHPDHGCTARPRGGRTMNTEYPVLVTTAAPQRAATFDRATRVLRTHPLEILLFATAIALLTTTVVVTARVALDTQAQAQDLTFSGTLAELELALSNRGPDQLATLERATLPGGVGPIVVDTI